MVVAYNCRYFSRYLIRAVAVAEFGIIKAH